MARKKHFLDGLAYRKTEINPADVVYSKGVERPSDEEIVKEVDKQEFRYNRVAIYMSGTIIVAAASRVIFRVELSLPILLGIGAAVGTVLFCLDRWIVQCFKNRRKKKQIRIE